MLKKVSDINEMNIAFFVLSFCVIKTFIGMFYFWKTTSP